MWLDLLLLLSRFSRVRLCAGHRRQPTRLPRPWDSPPKNTGVGCHFLLQCMKVKSESEVTESCPTLSDPMDCSPPSSSVHGIFQGSTVTSFSSCLQSFPTLGSFPISQFFPSGSQSIGASASVLPMNIWLGIESGSPGLEGGFSTTGLPGKSSLLSTYHSRQSAMNFKNNLISVLQLLYIKTQCITIS